MSNTIKINLYKIRFTVGDYYKLKDVYNIILIGPADEVSRFGSPRFVNYQIGNSHDNTIVDLTLHGILNIDNGFEELSRAKHWANYLNNTFGVNLFSVVKSYTVVARHAA